MRIVLSFLFFLTTSTASLLGQSATALYQRATDQVQQNDFTAADATLDQLIERYPNRLYDLAGAYLLKSQNSLALQQFTEAFALNKKSQAIQEQLGAEELALNYVQDGQIYAQMGDLPKAIKLWKKALDQAFYSSELLAAIYIQMADAFLKLEKNELALNHADQAVAIFQIMGSADQTLLGKAYLQMAQALFHLEREEEAQTALQAAIKLLSAKDGHRLLLGQCYALQSTQLADTERNQAIQNAFRSWKPLLTNKNVDAAKATSLMATLPGGKEWKSGPKDLTDFALLALFPQAQFDIEVDNLENQPPINGLVFARTLALKAQTVKSLGLAQIAVQYLERHLQLHPHELPNLLRDQSWKKIYLTATELAIGDQKITEAFTYGSRLKEAQAYMGRVAPLWLDGTYPASLQKQAQAVAKTQALFQLQPKDQTAADRNKQAKEELSAAIKALKGIDAELFTLQAPLGLSALQKGLSKEEAMIQYVVGEERTWGLVARFDQVYAIPLQLGELPSFVTALDAATTSAFQDIAFQWYEKAFAPLQSFLDGIDEIHVILDTELGMVPFEALIDKKRSTTSFRRLHYLLDSYSFSYSFTAHPLAVPSLPKALTYFTPMVGGTEISRSGQLYFDTTFQLLPVLHQMVPDGRHLATTEAPAIRAEVAEQMSKKDAPMQVLKDRDATVSALNQTFTTPTNLHIAGPVYGQSALPPYLGLMYKTQEGTAQATASNLYPSDWKATLVSFAQFYSDGIGGMLALTDRMQQAGVGYVTIAMQPGEGDYFWPEFYKYMLREETGTKAMYRAKRKLQNKSKTAAPKHWAGYLLFR